jgi:tetratricopeptide (TPR) repeat protein
LGQFNKAEEYLKDILSMKGDYTSLENTLYPISYYWLGIINQELGKNSIAITHYKIFLNYWQNADPDIIELNDAKKRLDELESNV